VVYGKATVSLSFEKTTKDFYLDLKCRDEQGYGMQVDRVDEQGQKVDFRHAGDRLSLFVLGAKKGEQRVYTITYHGIPKDGLIISVNKFGERVFFGDNWPDRARHWLPSVDHPSDKALVDFVVQAPAHYQVVSNGRLVDQKQEGDMQISHWKSDVPLPTKVMVIGVAHFAIQELVGADSVPVSSWVFPQNKKAGFEDYRVALKSLDFFTGYLSPFPFAKLANVQSKTIYGGMENAACIFYAENSVTGDQRYRWVFAHEIAHQWFGDAVTEADWQHVWLSEGFATYLTDLYVEHQQGRDAFVQRMLEERSKVVDFAYQQLSPVIDTAVTDYMDLLNANTYQKAAWILHMLRHEIGDELFQQCLQEFYQLYKYRNATTRDFQDVVARVSGKDFQAFFHQWLCQSGHPVLRTTWQYQNKEIKLSISQHQTHFVFSFPLEIAFVFNDGSVLHKTVQINQKETTISIQSNKLPQYILLDPNVKLLFENGDY